MFGEVNVIPTLRQFRGGQSRGGGQLKKTPCIKAIMSVSLQIYYILSVIVDIQGVSKK